MESRANPDSEICAVPSSPAMPFSAVSVGVSVFAASLPASLFAADLSAGAEDEEDATSSRLRDAEMSDITLPATHATTSAAAVPTIRRRRRYVRAETGAE